jgi:hypothetical protein
MNMQEYLVLPVLPLSGSCERPLKIRGHALLPVYKLFQIFSEINGEKYLFLDERDRILERQKAL